MTERSPYRALATSVRIRSRASPARPAFSTSVIVFAQAATEVRSFEVERRSPPGRDVPQEGSPAARGPAR